MAKPRNNPTQSALDFEQPSKRSWGRFSFVAAGAEALRWLPLMGLLALLAQIGIRGLRPAMAEDLELKRKDAQLEELYSAAVERQTQLELRLRAQDDPIYVERMRRLRVRDEFAPQPSEVDSQ